MKALLVYYSLTGSVKEIVKTVQKNSGLPARELIDTKRRDNVLSAGFAAFFGLSTKLKDPNFDVSKYDTLILLTPIWAGCPTPAMNTFIRRADLRGKKIFLVGVGAAPNNKRAIEKFRRIVRKFGGRIIGTRTYRGINPMRKKFQQRWKDLEEAGHELTRIFMEND